MKATKVCHVGVCDAASYPMAKKKQSMEFLREKAHLRPRTNTIGAVARIRNALAFATHKFFNDNGFYYVHTPIITASDCEGAGEMFQVGAGCSAREARREAGQEVLVWQGFCEGGSVGGDCVATPPAANGGEEGCKDTARERGRWCCKHAARVVGREAWCCDRAAS